jgi:predicted glycosyltransferase
MQNYQIINFAAEVLELMDDLNFTLDEALEEIKAVMETEYKEEIQAEIEEDILYFYDDVLSDILTEIKKVVNKYKTLVLN